MNLKDGYAVGRGEMMDWEYLRQNPEIERKAKKIAYAAGEELYSLQVCILLLRSRREIVEAYQYIYRGSRTLYVLCDFILFLKDAGVVI